MRITLTPETRKNIFKNNPNVRETIWAVESGQHLNPVDKRALLNAAVKR